VSESVSTSTDRPLTRRLVTRFPTSSTDTAHTIFGIGSGLRSLASGASSALGADFSSLLVAAAALPYAFIAYLHSRSRYSIEQILRFLEHFPAKHARGL